MRKVYVAGICMLMFLCSGCPATMTRDEVIAAKEQCEAAGMVPVMLLSGLTWETRAVRCDMPEPAEKGREQ